MRKVSADGRRYYMYVFLAVAVTVPMLPEKINKKMFKLGSYILLHVEDVIVIHFLVSRALIQYKDIILPV